MKNAKSIVAVLLAVLMMTAVLTACGDSKDTTPADSNTPDTTQNQTQPQSDPGSADDNAAVTGQSAEWGDYTFLVPAGFELKEGGEFSAYDFSVRKSDFYYFDFNTEADDDNMMQHYNYNKNTYINEQVEFEIVYGDNTWTGFQYSDGFGGYGFEAYTTIDGKIVRVSSAGYQSNSAIAEFVLNSFAKK